MGIYLNPGNANYTDSTISALYVDKTGMIEVTNHFIDTRQKYICISRPRRFGKTIAGNMLSAYYSKGCDSAELFVPFKIAQSPGFLEKLNQYNAIKFDMNSEYQNIFDKEKLIRSLTKEILSEMKACFHQVRFDEEDTLAKAILRVYAATGETFIIIIDEYDVLVREQAEEKIFQEYLSFLNGLFKSDTLRPAIALAYLTGILPVIRDKVQSKLNNFREYTILNAGPMAEYVGFTSDEVVQKCEENNIDFEECRRWYDGYRMQGYEIYNPESVVRCIEEGSFESFWGRTSSYEAISDRIRQNFAGTKDAVIRMLSGERVEVDVDAYLNTTTDFTGLDDTLSYLIHLGYLAYDRESGTCAIPNREVRAEWFRALKKIPDEYAVTSEIIARSKELLEKTWRMEADAVAAALDVSHIHVTSNRSYNNEDALQSAVYLAFIYALNRYTVIKEMTTGKGFADVVFIPFYEGDPAMIIELKRNNSAASAIHQIREKQFFGTLSHYRGKLLFVGIDYDEKKKTHSCQIEIFQK